MITRKRFAASAVAGVGSAALLRFPGNAAEFTYRLATTEPATHPTGVRALEAAARIKRESGGRLEINVFPEGSLGNPTQLINQLRLGAIQMHTPAMIILANVVPVCAIDGLPFIYNGYQQAWNTRDGALGAYMRAAVDKLDLHTLEKAWDDGMRHCFNNVRPIAVPDDLRGLKLRIGAAILQPAFKALGASPTPIELTEEYTSLQTHIVDGAEQPLSVIYATKFFEVSHFLSITDHGATGLLFVVNGPAWRALPKDLQDMVERDFNAAALQQRKDVSQGDITMEATLKTKGMASNHADLSAFKAAIRKAGLFSQWRSQFGTDAWSLLEKSVGSLA